MIIEAKELFAKGNFEEAKQLTLQARKDLLSMRQIIDETESGLADDLGNESELRGRESENEVRGREAENESAEAGSGRNR